MEAHTRAGDSIEAVTELSYTKRGFQKGREVVAGGGVPWRVWRSLEEIVWGRLDGLEGRRSA